MDTEYNPIESEEIVQEQKPQVKYRVASSENVYAMGLFGAWVFYIGRAKTFKEGLLGFLKAFIWPGILVYKALALLDRQEEE